MDSDGAVDFPTFFQACRGEDSLKNHLSLWKQGAVARGEGDALHPWERSFLTHLAQLLSGKEYAQASAIFLRREVRHGAVFSALRAVKPGDDNFGLAFSRAVARGAIPQRKTFTRAVAPAFSTQSTLLWMLNGWAFSERMGNAVGAALALGYAQWVGDGFYGRVAEPLGLKALEAKASGRGVKAVAEATVASFTKMDFSSRGDALRLGEILLHFDQGGPARFLKLAEEYNFSWALQIMAPAE